MPQGQKLLTLQRPEQRAGAQRQRAAAGCTGDQGPSSSNETPSAGKYSRRWSTAGARPDNPQPPPPGSQEIKTYRRQRVQQREADATN